MTFKTFKDWWISWPSRKWLSVDTLFLTVLKTWTSSFEHSMIIHVCVRPEFSEVSITRLVSRPLDLPVLCLVLHQTLVVLLLRVGNGLLVIPTPHWPWLEATGLVLLLPAIGYGRSAIFMVGRPLFWSICHFWLADQCSFAFDRYFMPAVIAGIHNAPPPYTCMEGFPSCLACFVSFARLEFL